MPSPTMIRIHARPAALAWTRPSAPQGRPHGGWSHGRRTRCIARRAILTSWSASRSLHHRRLPGQMLDIDIAPDLDGDVSARLGGHADSSRCSRAATLKATARSAMEWGYERAGTPGDQRPHPTHPPRSGRWRRRPDRHRERPSLRASRARRAGDAHRRASNSQRPERPTGPELDAAGLLVAEEVGRRRGDASQPAMPDVVHEYVKTPVPKLTVL